MAKFKCFTLEEIREKERNVYKTFQTISKIRKEKEDDEDSDGVELAGLVNLEYFNRGRWLALCDLIDELEEDDNE